MSYHTPEAKSEQAFEKILSPFQEADLKGVQIIKRGSTETIVTPSINIIAPRAVPDVTDGDTITGNYYVTLVLTVKSHHKDNDIVTHDSYLGVISDLITSNVLPAALNEVMADEEFTAFLWTPGERNSRIEGSFFVSEQEGVLYMAPSKLTSEGE